MEVDEPTLRTILMTYKRKTHTADNHGKIISNADIDFYINEDIIHVTESKLTKHYGDYFLRQVPGIQREVCITGDAPTQHSLSTAHHCAG